MKKNLYLIVLLAVACILPATAQQKAEGFSNLKIYIDPGHYGTYNMGYGNYSEAEKVLVIAHYIKEFFTTYTDMPAANIKLSREKDSDAELGFDTRADECAAMGAHFFYSIHSDAPSLTSGATLYMYGGRRLTSGGAILEKLPEGGKLFGDILNADLTPVLRLNKGTGIYVHDASRGNMPDLQFYNSTSTTPYLAVNRYTNNRTASLLSEAGFHTNPQQNMQFVNVEFKRMQAYASYQTLVKYLSEKHLGGRINPVQVGIATGFVFDGETNRPVNGAKITVTEAGKDPKIYTTDTYESLPKKYAFKPEEFGNGFYWLEGFTPGASVTVKVEATGFETQTSSLTIPATVGATTIEGLGVKDFSLLNTMPSKIVNVETTRDLDENVIPRYPLNIVFSRKMDKASVEAAFSISPAANITLSWPNDFTLKVDLSKVAFETFYTITINGSIAKNSVTNQLLDGDGDGNPGGNYKFAFATSELDETPPTVVSYDPQGDQEISARPIVRIEFDEPLNDLTIGHTPITVTDSKGEIVDGIFNYFAMSNFKSVMHFLFFNDLQPQETYTVKLNAGIEDLYGNAIAADFVFNFTARPKELIKYKIVDDFPAAGLGTTGWWAPNGSGSTNGIVVAETSTVTANHSAIATKNVSMKINYLWDFDLDKQPEPDPEGRIRVHRRGDPRFTKEANTQLQYYLFGDGSNSKFRATVRGGSTDGSGPIWSCFPFVIDWVGWKLITWELYDAAQGQEWLSDVKTGLYANGTQIDVKEFGLHPIYPYYVLPSYIIVDRIAAVELGDFIPGTGIKQTPGKTGINVTLQSDFINISANAAIKDVKVYSIAGALLKSAQPGQASYQIPTGDLTPGIYIVKVATETSQTNVKVVAP